MTGKVVRCARLLRFAGVKYLAGQPLTALSGRAAVRYDSPLHPVSGLPRSMEAQLHPHPTNRFDNPVEPAVDGGERFAVVTRPLRFGQREVLGLRCGRAGRSKKAQNGKERQDLQRSTPAQGSSQGRWEMLAEL